MPFIQSLQYEWPFASNPYRADHHGDIGWGTSELIDAIAMRLRSATKAEIAAVTIPSRSSCLRSFTRLPRRPPAISHSPTASAAFRVTSACFSSSVTYSAKPVPWQAPRPAEKQEGWQRPRVARQKPRGSLAATLEHWPSWGQTAWLPLHSTQERERCRPSRRFRWNIWAWDRHADPRGSRRIPA